MTQPLSQGATWRLIDKISHALQFTSCSLTSTVCCCQPRICQPRSPPVYRTVPSTLEDKVWFYGTCELWIPDLFGSRWSENNWFGAGCPACFNVWCAFSEFSNILQAARAHAPLVGWSFILLVSKKTVLFFDIGPFSLIPLPHLHNMSPGVTWISAEIQTVRSPACELFPVVSLQLFPKLMKLLGTAFFTA